MNNIDEIIKKTSPAYVFFVIISGVAYVIFKLINKDLWHKQKKKRKPTQTKS